MKVFSRNIAPLAILKAVALVALVAFVVVWSVANSGGLNAIGRESVRFWCGFTGPDGVTMLKIIKGFNADHEGESHVTMQRMEWATYYNKLLVAGLGDRSPEVFVLHVTSLPRFYEAGLLDPVDDVFTTGGLDRADFDENVFKHVIHDGKIMGVPLDVHCSGMYYNPELFQKAGLASPDGTVTPPATREEFMNALRAYQQNGPKGTFGFGFGYLEFDMYNMVAQWGGKFVSDDYSRCTLDSPENVAAMQFAYDLIHKHKLAPPMERKVTWTGFRQKQLAMAWEGVWMIGDLKRLPDLNYKPAVLPQLGPQKGAYASSHILCVSKDLEPERREAALDLIKYLSDHSLDWAEAGQIPARKSLRNTDRFRAMEVQSEFAKQIPYLWFRPMVPFESEIQYEWKIAIEKILYGTQTPEEALGQATKNVNAAIERYRQVAKAREAAKAEEAAE